MTAALQACRQLCGAGCACASVGRKQGLWGCPTWEGGGGGGGGGGPEPQRPGAAPGALASDASVPRPYCALQAFAGAGGQRCSGAGCLHSSTMPRVHRNERAEDHLTVGRRRTGAHTSPCLPAAKQGTIPRGSALLMENRAGAGGCPGVAGASHAQAAGCSLAPHASPRRPGRSRRVDLWLHNWLRSSKRCHQCKLAGITSNAIEQRCQCAHLLTPHRSGRPKSAARSP